MPRKILISFLGTGQFAEKQKRTYKTTEYHLGDKNLGKYSFVAAALEKYYEIDSTFLIGTTHSMWEEVYRWHRENDNLNVDDDVYLEIAESCEKANHLSDLDIPHQKAIEEALGNDSKVVLIKYGITEDEVRENIDTILGIEQFLKKGDELIVDVTHSFRSLPFFMTNLLFYLQNVSDKKIIISHIHYGMMEMINEQHFAPIVELRTIIDINNWIIGAYSFSKFGNAYMISELIQQENLSAANLLVDFSNVMNLNHLFAIKTIAQRLSSIKNAQYNTSLPKLIINPIIDNFINTFKPSTTTKESVFQLKVARWQLEHRKYAQAFMTLIESIVSNVCEMNNMDSGIYQKRELAKEALRHSNQSNLLCDEQLVKIYQKIRKMRNATAHAIEINTNSNKMINTLNTVTKQLERIIR